MRQHVHIPAAALLTVLFCGLLAACLIGTFAGWDFYPNQENRRLAECPKPGTDRVSEIPAKADAFLNDHFGFRNTFIYRYNKTRKKWLKTAPDQVIIGRDGWLFLNDVRMRYDYERKDPLSGKQLAALQHGLEARKAWLEERGIRYFFVVAPNKSSIYPEYLPDYIKIGDGPSRLDQFMDHMRRNSDVCILDLRPALLEAKKTEQVYHSTDMHWNDIGAYCAYRAIMDVFRTQFPELTVRQRSEFIAGKVDWLGDLARLSGMSDEYPEVSPVLTIPDPYRPASLEVQVPENHGWNWQLSDPPVVLSNPHGKYRLLVFHDSFIWHGVRMPLAWSFNHSVFFHMRPEKNSLEYLVGLHHPDAVMEEVLERYLLVFDEVLPEWQEAWNRRYGK